MKNQSENYFKTKFRLLNSQENSEEIIWSCSDSSDYENTNQNENLGKANQPIKLNRKRERGKTRKKTLRNISNLNIMVVDSAVQQKNEKMVEMSPVQQKVRLSPILTDSQQHIFAPINTKKVISSPILSCNSQRSNKKFRTAKSPVLLLNHTSPKISPNVRKKLFNNNNSVQNKSESNKNGRSTSPVLNCSQIIKKSRLDYSTFQENAVKTIKPFNTNIKQDVNILNKLSGKFEKTDLSKQIQMKNVNRMNASEEISNDSLHTATASAVLEKVKSYFDSHFSSETLSQQSISEYDTTPKNSSKTSEEIEIINSQTDKKFVPQVIKLENQSSSDSLRSYDFQMKKSKKVRYKKDGLAYRLSVLLKKQKANICLWQHERFLAANSNFVLPNDDFTAFLIQNVTFKYGCYLLEVTNGEENKYFVLINHLNINNNRLEQCNIFKLYRPFKILEVNSEYGLIVNVSKFECTILITNR